MGSQLDDSIFHILVFFFSFQRFSYNFYAHICLITRHLYSDFQLFSCRRFEKLYCIFPLFGSGWVRHRWKHTSLMNLLRAKEILITIINNNKDDLSNTWNFRLQTTEYEASKSFYFFFFLKFYFCWNALLNVIVSVNDCVLMVPLESYPMNMNMNIKFWTGMMKWLESCNPMQCMIYLSYC